VVRTVCRQAAALTKARERRRALDAARDEHDRRVEEATAEALVALEARSEAEQSPLPDGRSRSRPMSKGC
jgi:hypothetical protein